jgi:hypothetical protein
LRALGAAAFLALVFLVLVVFALVFTLLVVLAPAVLVFADLLTDPDFEGRGDEGPVAAPGAFVDDLAADVRLAEPVVVEPPRLAAELVDLDDVFARFGLESPIGSASPTALMAPEAAWPTTPTTLPARLPTVFTILPGSGIPLSSCVGP